MRRFFVFTAQCILGFSTSSWDHWVWFLDLHDPEAASF
jgi:hypothetical protein